MKESIEASCHCGAVHLQINGPLQALTECNCSICRRYGVLWAYFSPTDVQIIAAQGATETYQWGDRTIAFHRCRTCGCLTHWSAVDESVGRMGVNGRLMNPVLVRSLRVRKLDGADTGGYLR